MATGCEFVGQSSSHCALLERLQKFALTDAEVLITGPTGTGKELCARYIHNHGARAKSAFVPINCGGIPDLLLENELFGHVGGAFTGARPQNDGLVAAAEGGTLFLDEVDTLSTAGQVKLLRLIQEREYRRLGETKIRRCNVRFIAASNADLEMATRSGRFRQDLFFRLRVLPITLPALAARPEDVPALIGHYVGHYSELYGLPAVTLSDASMQRLKSYNWPGNVRELENCVQYLTCLQLGQPIQPEDLPLIGQDEIKRGANGTKQSFQKAKKELLDLFEKNYLEEALQRSNGNISEAARASGKARRAFFELMRKHGLRAVGASVD